MSERLFGIETEYAFATFPQQGERADRGPLLQQLFECARRKLPHLPDQGSHGLFLANGARFYVDCGMHPEFTTPECANPWDIPRYIQAGERILADLARELVAAHKPLKEVIFFRVNLDYSGSKTTWGCHESYLHCADPSIIPKQILPHLVSRIIYTGAGGFDPFSANLSFTLSPRVAHLEAEVSGSSTSGRGIFHTKDESLSANGYHRLHLLCGESLCSELATFLKTGVTALIVAMIEANLKPGDEVELADPLGAMRRFAADPACRVTAKTKRGGDITAIQIQRHFLQLAEAHLHDEFMPLWADRVCAAWREILDRLERGGPDLVGTSLDWAIKLSVFNDWMNQKTKSWDGSQNGEQFQRLRQQLFEIDTRFGQVSANGDSIFAALDRGGALHHHFHGVDNIEHAMAFPPAVGRAGLRGSCVRRFAADDGRYRCDWTFIWDIKASRFLDLTEPFETVEKWQDAATSAHRNVFVNPSLSLIQQTFHTVHSHYASGMYDRAHELLCSLEAIQSRFSPAESDWYHRLRAWVQSRRGYLDALESLDAVTMPTPRHLSRITDYVLVYNHLGLVPKREIFKWIRRGRKIAESNDRNLQRDLPGFLVQVGYTLLRSGQPREALEVLGQALTHPLRELAPPFVTSRIYAEIGEAYRMLGDRIQAVHSLRKARRLQMSRSFEADLAEFTFAYRAKVETNTRRALAWLDRAKAIQTRLGHRMGEARTLLLQARIGTDPQVAAAAKNRLLELRSQLPVLAECKLLAKVLDHWDEWTGDKTLVENGDSFWGV